MKLPGFIRRKITRSYMTVEIVLLTILAGVLLFVSAGLRRAG